MDIFGLRDRLVQDYAEYVKSFILIRDPQVRGYVEQELGNGLLWPEPLIQMNPSFEPGTWIGDLVQEGIIEKECSHIFRIKETPEDEGKLLHLHRQE